MAPPLPPPPSPSSPRSSDLAQRTLAAGQAMERSAIELAGRGQQADRERACSAFYLAQVAYARAVELGLNGAEAEIDRVETLKQSLGCDPSAEHAPASPPGP